MKKISCGVCKTKSPIDIPKALGNSGICRLTGFSNVWDQRYGLKTLYLCPKCTKKAMVHIRGLTKIFGEKMSFINFLPLIRDAEEEELDSLI